MLIILFCGAKLLLFFHTTKFFRKKKYILPYFSCILQNRLYKIGVKVRIFRTSTHKIKRAI